jgi:hypothetical protein
MTLPTNKSKAPAAASLPIADEDEFDPDSDEDMTLAKLPRKRKATGKVLPQISNKKTGGKDLRILQARNKNQTEEEEEEEEPEDVYVYPKWSAEKQEKFNRQQKLAKLQDEHNVRLENYELKYPDPPEWYCPLLNHLEKGITDMTVSSSQWTPGDQCPKDKYEEYKKQIKERTHGGVYNDAISKQMVHQWRQSHSKWYQGKQKLKEKLRKEFHVACSTTYSTLRDPQLNGDIVKKWKENI